MPVMPWRVRALARPAAAWAGLGCPGPGWAAGGNGAGGPGMAWRGAQEGSAAGRPGGAPIVKLLLANGANPNPTSNPGAESSPLLEASLAGDAEIMQTLFARGAELRSEECRV